MQHSRKRVYSLRQLSKLSFALCTALLCGGMAGAADVPLGVTVVTGLKDFPTGTPGFTATDGPGMDSSGQNLIVRNNDTIAYGINIGGNGNNSSITFRSTLPDIKGTDGQPAVTWTRVPSECSTSLSSLTDNGRTLVCVLPGTTTDVSLSIKPIALVSSYAPNGMQLNAPVTTISSDENPTVVSTDPATEAAYTVTVSAAPRYDLAKTLPSYLPNPSGQNGDGNNYALRRVPGPGNAPGTLIAFPVVISAVDSIQNAENNELKGLAPLKSPITFTDVLPIPGAVLYNTGPAWAGVSPVLGGSAGACVATGVASPGGMNSLANGTCTATQSGQTVTVTISDLLTDNSVTTNQRSSFVTNQQGGKVLNSELQVFSKVLLIWVPDSALPANTATIYKNTYSNFTATATNGTPNTQPPMGLNNGTTDPNGTVDDDEYFVLTPPSNANAYYSKRFNPEVTSDKGAAYTQTYTDGSTGHAYVGMGNNGAADLHNPIICEKFDNTTFVVNPDANGNVVSGITTSDGNRTGVLGTDYTVEYGVGGVGGVGDTWVRDSANHSSDQANATCADDQSPVWYTSLSAVPGGASAVTKIRVKLLYPIRGSVNALYGIQGVSAAFAWKATGTPQIGPNKGIPYTSPVYMDNWGTLSADEFDGKNSDAATQDKAGHYWATRGNVPTTPYTSPLGDEAWLVPAKTGISISIPSVTQPNGDTLTNVPTGRSVTAGSTVTYQINPTLTLPNSTPTSSYPVTVTDTIPAGMTYVTGSASRTPSSLTVNPDGTTTITWVIPGVVPNSTITPITFKTTINGVTPDGTTLTNTASITATTDPIAKTAPISLTVSNPPGVAVTKTVLTPYAIPTGSADYQLTWYNIGAGTTGLPQVIDVLPYVGDGRGTTNNPAGLAAAPSAPSNDTSMVFYYTSATPSSIKTDPADPSNDLTTGTTKWCQITDFGTVAGCPTSLSTVTGVRGISTLKQLDAGISYSITISIKTSQSPNDNDLYANSFRMRSTTLTYAPGSQNVVARVRLFSISGTIYNDANSNGVRESGEAGLSSVGMTLSGYTFGPDGQDNGGSGDDVALSGTPIKTTTTTDASGNYTFTNLPPGRYSVTETQPAAYTTTSNTPGQVNGTATGTVTGDTISGIVMARDITNNQATGYNFGEIKSYTKPGLKKWSDNCGTSTNLSGCPAVHTASDAIATTPNTALPGDIMRYTIILNNANALALANTIIHDNIPDNTTFIGATADLIPAAAGVPLASYTANPYAWNACTASSSAATCSLGSTTAASVKQLNVGWDNNGDGSITSTDNLPANTQMRVTFWVKVN